MDAPYLFAHLYFDEDVHVGIANILRGHGYQARTARDEDMLAKSDVEQLAFAAEHKMALVTHNRADFEELALRYYEEERAHWGVICVFRRPPYELARRLMVLLNQQTASELRDQLLYV